MFDLVVVLVEQGGEAAVGELRTWADAGNRDAARRLAELLVEQGDWKGAAQVWRPLADAGDRYAARRLAELLAGQGDVHSLRRELWAGNTPHAAARRGGLAES